MRTPAKRSWRYDVRLTSRDGQVSFLWAAAGFPDFENNLRVAKAAAAAQVGKSGVVKAEVVRRTYTVLHIFTLKGAE